MVLNAKAHGKLLLFGEHAVVHGFPAVGLTLPLRTELWLSHGGDGLNASTLPHPTDENRQLVDALVPHMGDAAQTLWQQEPWHVHLHSDVPMGRGLGSSAALTGALARVFAQGAAEPISHEDIWRMAHRAERKYHGHPSGVDTALALGSGLQAVTPRQDCLPDVRAYSTGPFALVAGTVPRDTNTQILVQRVQERVDTRPRATLDILNRLGQLADLPPMLEDAGADLGERANEAHALLQTLGLSTPMLDACLEAGLDAGAFGGKLSGAGGGGAFALICGDSDGARVVRQAIDRRFADTPSSDRPQLMVFQWDGHELHLVSDKESISC